MKKDNTTMTIHDWLSTGCTEAERFIIYKNTSKTEFSDIFDLVVHALNTNTQLSLRTEYLQQQCALILSVIAIEQRFDILRSKCGDLVMNGNKFSLLGHEFDTLDQVEKAINNKAFL